MTFQGLSRRTVVVWLALLVLVIALIQINDMPVEVDDGHGHGSSALDDLPEGRFPVFAFSEAEIGSVTIVWKGRHVDFERGRNGGWEVGSHAAEHSHGPTGHSHDHGHMPSPQVPPGDIAEQFAISARMLADRSIQPERALSEYGLEEPEIAFTFRDRLNRDPLAVMQVGDLLVNGYSYYAVLERGPSRILLIPRYQINLLLALAFGDEAPPPLPILEDESGATSGPLPDV